MSHPEALGAGGQQKCRGRSVARIAASAGHWIACWRRSREQRPRKRIECEARCGLAQAKLPSGADDATRAQ